MAKKAFVAPRGYPSREPETRASATASVTAPAHEDATAALSARALAWQPKRFSDACRTPRHCRADRMARVFAPVVRLVAERDGIE
jgi:hypothetical protein